MAPRFAIPLAVLVALIAMFAIGLHHDPQLLPSPLIGKPAPLFALPSIPPRAAPVTPADFRGHPLLVNFFASWCVDCQLEQAALAQLAQSGEIRVLGIDYKDSDADAGAWLARHGNPYSQVIADRSGSAALDWGVYGVPESFLVGADGRILHKLVGPLTAESWKTEFRPFLARSQP